MRGKRQHCDAISPLNDTSATSRDGHIILDFGLEKSNENGKRQAKKSDWCSFTSKRASNYQLRFYNNT